MVNMPLVVLIFLSFLNVAANGQRSTVLYHQSFEKDEFFGWVHGKDVSLSLGQAYAGKGSVQLKSEGMESPSISLPQLKEPKARLVRISLFFKAPGLHDGDITIRLLKHFQDGRAPEWFDNTSPTFMALPKAQEWKKVTGEGLIGPEIESLKVYFVFTNQTNKPQAWVDELTVELLDRGLLFMKSKQGNIFDSERAKLELAISSPKELTSGDIFLKDEENHTLKKIPIPPSASHVEIDLPSRGYYSIHAEAQYKEGWKCTIETSAAVVGPRLPEKDLRRSPFGMDVCWSKDILATAGGRWDRPGENLSSDYYKKAFEKGFLSTRPTPITGSIPTDVRSIYTLWLQPEWLQDRQGKPSISSSNMYPIRDWKSYRRLIQYVVKSIPNKVEFLELTNEPECVWHGTWAQMVQYLRAEAEAVRSVSPETKILGPSLCAIKTNELREFARLGLFDFLDGLSIHAYVNATAPENEFIQNVRELKIFLASIGKKDLPIFITEFGWTLPPGDWQKPVDPLTLARYVSRSLVLLAAEEIPVIIYYNQRWAVITEANGKYSLLNWDYTPRPSFVAYANVPRFLAGVTGPGKCLNLTPTVWMVLFKKENHTVAAVWDTQGTSSIFIPPSWQKARDMMGRPVRGSPSGMVSVGPSPVFIETSVPSFYHITEGAKISIVQGGSFDLPWPPAWMPSGFRMNGKTVLVDKSVSPGKYLLVGTGSQGWQTVPVQVHPPLSVTQTRVLWPASALHPQLQAHIRSFRSTPTLFSGIMKLDTGESVSSSEKILSREQTTDILFPLDNFSFGRRYTGKLFITGRPAPSTLIPPLDLDITLIPCLKGSEWDRIPVMDISSWCPFNSSREQVPPFSPEDCSGTLQAGYDGTGLHLRIAVRDNIHYQNQTPKRMWEEDSIQLGFDMDAEKPWQTNGVGYNGHLRVFEYGAALGGSGPMTWRWISYDQALPADQAETRIKTEVSRSGDHTFYILTFPWPVLGLNRQPSAGGKIGFSLVVNDLDPQVGTHGLRLFGGINDGKDPARFGFLWFR